VKKKRLTKGQKKVVEELEEIRNRTLISLKGRIEFLIKRSEELLTRIGNEGTTANYSVSSDIYRIAEDVYPSVLCPRRSYCGFIR
jgi:hypothetical protein